MIMETQMTAPVTVYWRPGCPFCVRLRQDLRVMGLPTREVNIWAEPAAAARVRSLAGGNETVPTVVVGEPVLVNPSASEILARVRQVDPGFTPDAALVRAGRWMRVLHVIQWAVVAALVAAGLAAEAAGHSGLSWLADGVAVAVWLLFRLARRRLAR
jgi:mycoredoxin